MLVRAARRKARSQAIPSRSSCDLLPLTWLCPSYTPYHRDRRRITVDSRNQGFGLTKRRSSNDASSKSTRRALATAVGYRPLDDIPFEGISGIPPPPRGSTGRDLSDLGGFSELKPFDSLSTLRLGDNLAAAPQRYRTNKAGVGGNMTEIRSIFDACLHVGRLERATVILRRINKPDIEPSWILELYNAYLRAAVEQIMMNPSQTATQELHKWFELEMRNNGVQHDAATIAYMVKASLQSQGSRRARLVRRYMEMVSEDIGYQVLCLDILTAEEVNHVTHICPGFSLAEDPDMILEDNEETVLEKPVHNEQAASTATTDGVRPTEQKGLGLKSLKQTLSLFSTLPRQGVDLATANFEERREIQARLEEDAVSSAVDRWREENSQLTKMGMNNSLQTKSLGARMWRWHGALEQQLKDEFVKLDAAELADKKSTEDSERCIYGPFLRIISPEKLAAVTILSIMTALGTTGVDRGLPLSNAILAIAHSVEDESAFEVLQKSKANKIWPSMDKGDRSRCPASPDLMKRLSRSRQPGSIAKILSDEPSDSTAQQRQWPLTIKAKVGAFLMSALIDSAKIPVTLRHPDTDELVTQMQPAFSHSHQYRMGKKVGTVLANKVLMNQLKREPVHSLLAKHLPMIVEPEPWTKFNKGGFLAHPSKIMRIKLGDKDQRHYAEAAISQGNMEQTFKGLDVLGKTSWRINQPVFDIMLEAWNSGEAIANIAPENPTLTVPPEPDSSQDPLERRRWIRAVKLIENTKGGLHSQRCFQNFQLEIARALKHETFFFPHNVDFRGRAYPIPPYLNHMGADHCRGLLRFGEGKELGEAGLRWLKIQLANVFGFDKASLSEREAFAMDNLENIYDSVLKPLTGKRWWLQAEDPWQCLAACIEVKNALESPDPTRFISHLPIHQDGTCNGLQHYAALGGDSWGAKQVNLEPADRPADVYTAVANLVKESIATDKEKGNPFAMVLDGKITRKVVKQTVMTNVYGVTYIGAKAQVRKQLVAAYPDLPNDDFLNPGTLSAYIATKIFTALSTMFRGAHDIQYWLGECASRISMSLSPEQLERLENEWPVINSRASKNKNKSASGKDAPSSLDELVQFKSSVIWTNPLHMPVVQPYRNSKSKTITTNLQRISLSEPHRSNPVSKRKQLQGFPPNFVHSLDATHMLLSALKCDEMGLSFAAVHDSFWTHACDVPTMSTVLRDTFIRIHSEDVIGRLAAEFSARYKDSMYLAKIRTESAIYKKVLAWRESKESFKNRKFNVPKAQKAPRLDELRLERERIRLLRSSDPTEVVKGKAMVTPASIFQEMATADDLAPDEELQDQGLGDISTREARLMADQRLEVGDLSDVEEVNNPLPGGTGLDAAMSGDLDEKLDETENDHDEKPFVMDDSKSNFEKNLTKTRRVAQTKSSYIWLPLTFPPVPKKGEFDVTRLKDSQYFFS